MKWRNKVKIKLNYDQVTDIIVKDLQESYRIMTDDMIRIGTMMTPPKHRKEDFEDQKKMRKAIKEVLSYYMIKEDFDAWVKKTGVVND